MDYDLRQVLQGLGRDNQDAVRRLEHSLACALFSRHQDVRDIAREDVIDDVTALCLAGMKLRGAATSRWQMVLYLEEKRRIRTMRIGPVPQEYVQQPSFPFMFRAASRYLGNQQRSLLQER